MTDPIFESMDPLGRCDFCDEKVLTHELTTFSRFELGQIEPVNVCRRCLARLVSAEQTQDQTKLRVISRKIANRFRRKAA